MRFEKQRTRQESHISNSFTSYAPYVPSSNSSSSASVLSVFPSFSSNFKSKTSASEVVIKIGETMRWRDYLIRCEEIDGRPVVKFGRFDSFGWGPGVPQKINTRLLTLPFEITAIRKGNEIWMKIREKNIGRKEKTLEGKIRYEEFDNSYILNKGEAIIFSYEGRRYAIEFPKDPNYNGIWIYNLNNGKKDCAGLLPKVKNGRTSLEFEMFRLKVKFNNNTAIVYLENK